ncbi:MAG: hypothetical protein J7501_17420 [Bdellovibrio sp.]|nr:hypothetical protein [Bdellovibrio sp.]
MKTLITLIFLLSTQAFAAFQATNTRYLSGAEIVDKVFRTLPADPSQEKNYCQLLNQDRSAAGISDPLTGNSIYQEPSSTFYIWYDNCLKDALSADLYGMASSEVRKRHLGPLASSNYDLWSKVTEQDLKTLIAYQMTRILGPDEVILDYGYISDCDQFREELLKAVLAKGDFSVMPALFLIETELMKRDEFLSY